MALQLLADLVLVLHSVFIAFVMFGGLIALCWKPIIWLHLPALLWGALIAIFGWVCPLTPLENSLRHLAGEAGYSGGFIAHYIAPVIYPAGLTPSLRVIMAVALVAVNVMIYLYIWRRRNSN